MGTELTGETRKRRRKTREREREIEKNGEENKGKEKKGRRVRGKGEKNASHFFVCSLLTPGLSNIPKQVELCTQFQFQILHTG